MSNDTDKPLTARDLERALHDLERDLKQFITERELGWMRWAIALQITYFFGTLAAVWFMVSHLPK